MNDSEPARPLILYVDDERANRVVFEASFRAEFNILSAADGEAALRELATRDVAVLITDMRMPGMTGDELLRIVKDRHPQVIRIVMTAYQDIAPILAAVNEGLVARYIVKPWDRDELAQVLRWATEAWAFGRESAALQRRLLETERLATLGSIAGHLIHDLRQPLMSQMVNLEALSDLARVTGLLTGLVEGAGLPADQQAQVLAMLADLGPTIDDLKTSTEHMGQMISNLRELGRPRAAAAEERRTADPVRTLRHALTVCQELVVKARATASYEGPAELPAVALPATELMQVLVNVLGNAAQAVAARGEPHGRVRVIARLLGDQLELAIRDTGVGITPEVLAKIGRPFFTTRAEGTGLGVAQCQRLIGAAGGQFRIESELGTGTTVTLMLPLAPTPA